MAHKCEHEPEYRRRLGHSCEHSDINIHIDMDMQRHIQAQASFMSIDTDTDTHRHSHECRHPDMEPRHRYGYLKVHKHR